MTRGTTDTGGDADVAPVAPDRPFVDGARASSEELRAEAEAHAGDGDVERLRVEVGDTVAELTARFEEPVHAAVLGTRHAAIAAAATVLVLVLVRRLRRSRS